MTTLNLITNLCDMLAAENIDYCHWKSNSYLDRSASGDNDLDLLINRADAQQFAEILFHLGCKESLAPKAEELPGVRHYYGYDHDTGRLVHIHAHFQLILGSDLSKNYRLPIEKAYLASSYQRDLFRTPAPEFELVILVIRMVLKHSTWDAILMRHGQLSKTERRELNDLSTEETRSKVSPVLVHLPGLSQSLFELCLQSIQPDCPLHARMKAGRQLQKVLRACARRPHGFDIFLKILRRGWHPVLRRVFKFVPKYSFANGGLFIAIVGGDGAGKTTMIDELHDWLSGNHEVKKLHMGKPSWSWTTILIRAILKIGTLLQLYPFEGDLYEESFQPHGTPWFIRRVTTARDRYLTYMKGRRLSSNGTLVLCDRYSLQGFMKMDGPQCKEAVSGSQSTDRFLKYLINKENDYYQRIQLPDILIVLKADPDVAVQRKVEETEISVRARSSEILTLDWDKRSAFSVNANESKAETLSQIKKIVWEHL